MRLVKGLKRINMNNWNIMLRKKSFLSLLILRKKLLQIFMFRRQNAEVKLIQIRNKGWFGMRA